MEQNMIKHLNNTLDNWRDADVRTVPNVMYQIRYGRDANNVEFRFHLFISSEETYVHNHQYDFLSYCIQGEYCESLWNIDTTRSDVITYEFSRNSGNDIGLLGPKQGALYIEEKRHHFPGNVLSVTRNRFHSISSSATSNKMVVTFVARYICPMATRHTFIWSPEESIEAPTDQIEPATENERDIVYKQLKDIYEQRCCS